MANLPTNLGRAEVFKLLRERVAQILQAAVDGMAPGRTVAADDPLVKVYAFEQYPKGEDERKKIERVKDPVVGNSKLLVSFIELNFPGVREDPYTSETQTTLHLDLPITFVLGVGAWPTKADFPYPTSAQLFEAVFTTCGEALKNMGRSLGYDNVTHDYLQQTFADTDRDEDTGEPLSHTAQWLLPITVSGARH
jgi:hypothetical protein